MNQWLLTAGAIVLAVLLILLWKKLPGIPNEGKLLAFVTMGILPLLFLGGSWDFSQKRMQKVNFCMQCHEMRPFGESLREEDEEFVAGRHFLNNYVDQDKACYQCHTGYSAFGGVRAKLNGLRHVISHYSGNVPDTLRLFKPYPDKDCLHCHGPSQKFAKEKKHRKPKGRLEEIRSGKMSCMECHDVLHSYHGSYTQMHPPKDDFEDELMEVDDED